jgi:ketosteroid isomerase-like protein
MPINNKKIITQFYYSFATRKVKSMQDCYAENVIFKDPVFGELHGERAKKMWEMLLARNKNIDISVEDIFVGEDTGTAKWIAKYKFGKSKRKVINKVSASFVLKDNKIIEHIDNFNFYKWAKQALGLKGFLFGWTKWFQSKVRKEVNQKLDNYIASKK